MGTFRTASVTQRLKKPVFYKSLMTEQFSNILSSAFEVMEAVL